MKMQLLSPLHAAEPVLGDEGDLLYSSRLWGMLEGSQLEPARPRCCPSCFVGVLFLFLWDLMALEAGVALVERAEKQFERELEAADVWRAGPHSSGC